MWILVQLPYIFERMIAFSIPNDGEIWVMSYEGLHRITLSPAVSVWTDKKHAEDYKIYDAKKRMLGYDGRQYPMLGLHGGEPILVDPDGDRLQPDFAEPCVRIVDAAGDEKQVIEFADMSGDWGAATFSADGRHLVIGVPYRLCVYQKEQGMHGKASQEAR